ncbi:hypothetical protein [Falsiroseomonas oryziterrae]|uniref:hypothetical protein n=1 Tax=Falsiroseomonas oryziterrae TaxID=2911368 RepID=UPI001F2C736A|nr:hypothetical protein [Roseomonas sp. NPKOSM-4]
MNDGVIVHTTADADRFFPMLQATLPPTRLFCLRQGVALQAFIGLRRGAHPWQACYNRIAFLRDRLADGFRGWVIHLDADAFVADIGFDLKAYLDRHARTAMIHPPGGTRGRWDINSGVFLWNFAHEATRETAAGWAARLDAVTDEEMRTAPEWGGALLSDQPMLQQVLRDRPDLLDAVHVESAELIGYQHSGFIKQFVRNAVHTPEQRIARIAREAALALRRAAGAVRPDGLAVLHAFEALTGRPPPSLDAAFEGLEAPDHAALRAVVQRHAKPAG